MMSKNWTYHEGKALISVYAGRKDEYYKTRNKKHFWENILTELESQNILVSRTTIDNVEVKWRSLYRAYKNAKDRGTGSTPTKFLYMDEMEDIYHDNPIISSKHSVSVGVEIHPEPASIQIEPIAENIENLETPESTMDHNVRKKGKKKPANEYLKNKALELKRAYYKEVIEEKKKKRELLQNYFKKKEEDRERKNELILSLLAKQN